MTDQEKRRHERARAQGMAAYLWIGGQMTSAILENISAGGIFFRSPRPVAIGTPVKMRLVKPGLKDAIELRGLVVNAVSPQLALERGIAPGMGVQLDPIPAEQAGRFTLLLEGLGLPPPSAEQLKPEPAPASAGPVVVGAAQDQAPVLAPPSPPAPAVSPTPSLADATYEVHDAALRMPTPRVKPPAVSHEAKPAASIRAPDPVAFELAVPAGRPTYDEAEERARLMGHLTGVMNQLADATELLRQRDETIEQLRDTLAEARDEIQALKKQLGTA